MSNNENDNGNNGSKNPENDSFRQMEGAVDTIQQVQTPKMYKVILLNDDYTPMDFVVLVLKRFFAKTEEAANKIMIDVHKKGAGVAGVFTLEIAEMRAMQVNQFSRMNQHPLKTTLEPD